MFCFVLKYDSFHHERATNHQILNKFMCHIQEPIKHLLKQGLQWALSLGTIILKFSKIYSCWLSNGACLTLLLWSLHVLCSPKERKNSSSWALWCRSSARISKFSDTGMSLLPSCRNMVGQCQSAVKSTLPNE